MTSYTAIIVPVYLKKNDKLKIELFKQTLQNILKQEHAIAIIIDDQSPSKDIENICKEAKKENTQSTSFLFYTKNPDKDKKVIGPSNARNHGIDLVIDKPETILKKFNLNINEDTINHITFCDADDILPENSISIRKEKAKFDNLILTNRKNIDECGNELKITKQLMTGKLPLIPSRHMQAEIICHQSMFATVRTFSLAREHARILYKTQGLFDNKLNYGEDRDVTLTLLEVAKENGYKLVFIRKPLYHYRVFSESLSTTQNKEEGIRQQNYINKKHNKTLIGVMVSCLLQLDPRDFIKHIRRGL